MKTFLKVTGAVLLATATPLYAAAPGVEADLRASTVPGSRPASGTLDTTDPTTLLFRSSGQPDIAIPYARITEIHLADKKTLHLGVLPAILVYLIAQPIRHHTLSITYRDPADATEVVTLELSELQRNDAMLVLESRSKQACLDRGEFGTCQPMVLPPRTPLPVPRDVPVARAAPATAK